MSEGSRRKLTAFGMTLTLAEWSARHGVPEANIRARLALPWSPERAVSEPVASKSETGRVAATARWQRRDSAATNWRNVPAPQREALLASLRGQGDAGLAAAALLELTAPQVTRASAPIGAVNGSTK